MTGSKYVDALLSREVLLSLFVIGLVGTGMGTASWAYLEDADESAGNTVQASTLNLNVDGADDASGAFVVDGGEPGSAAGHEFVLTNDGSLSADHVEFAVAVSENDPAVGEPSDPELAADLNATETASLVRVTTLEYRNDSGGVVSGELGGVTDGNGNGIKDLEDVRAQSDSFDDLPAPQANAGNATRLAIAVEIASDHDGSPFVAGANAAGNLTGYDEDVMGDGVEVTVTVTLNQHADQ